MVSRRRKPAPKHVDQVIGVGYVFRDINGHDGTRLVEPTKQLLEIEAVKHLLDFWNRNPGVAWKISDRPDKRERHRPAPDFACIDAPTGNTALIDVAKLLPKKHFEKEARGPRKELVTTATNARKNVERLLGQKNRQLTGRADRRCVLFLFEGVSKEDDPFWILLSSAIREVTQPGAYPNIEEIYMWSQRPADPPIQIVP